MSESKKKGHKKKKKRRSTAHKKKKTQVTPESSADDDALHHHHVSHQPVKKWKTSPDDDGHHNKTSRKRANAKEARAAIVAQKRNQGLVIQHHSALRKQAIAINRKKFAKATKRERADGPRPADLPPRLTLGYRYDEEPHVSMFDAVLRGELGVIKSQVTEANEANRLQGQFPRGSLLHVAAQKGSLEILEYLLKNGGNVHLQDDLGNIPLHRATMRGDIKIVKMLVTYDIKEQKKQLDARNFDNLTPIQLAIQYGFEKIRSMYINYLKLEKSSVSADDRTLATLLSAHESEKRGCKKKIEDALAPEKDVDGGEKEKVETKTNNNSNVV
jgi:ankyrin repeat protein